jgi:hypothetical protein
MVSTINIRQIIDELRAGLPPGDALHAIIDEISEQAVRDVHQTVNTASSMVRSMVQDRQWQLTQARIRLEGLRGMPTVTTLPASIRQDPAIITPPRANTAIRMPRAPVRRTVPNNRDRSPVRTRLAVELSSDEETESAAVAAPAGRVLVQRTLRMLSMTSADLPHWMQCVVPHDTACSVCLFTVTQNTQEATLSKCGHWFHWGCIKRWIGNCRLEEDLPAPPCPACRTPFELATGPPSSLRCEC